MVTLNHFSTLHTYVMGEGEHLQGQITKVAWLARVGYHCLYLMSHLRYFNIPEF